MTVLIVLLLDVGNRDGYGRGMSRPLKSNRRARTGPSDSVLIVLLPLFFYVSTLVSVLAAGS